MPLPRKPGPAQSLALVGQIPNPPEMPSAVTDRFPEMAAWQEAFDRWWNRFQDLLQRDLDQISTQFKKDEGSTQTSLKTIQDAIDTINIDLGSIIGKVPLPAQIAALTSQLANLTFALAAHIANTITHGTVGDIVGTTDRQDLDSKQIGRGISCYGRFWPLVGVNSIQGTENITLAFGDYILAPGPFFVYGQLVVDGTLLVL